MGCVMSEEQTAVAVRRYLDELAGDSPSEPVIRALLDRAVRRLHQLCGTLLYRSYPRLTRPPLNLQTDEMLGAVVERLLKALREARPATEREFFGLACQHMRRELNDLARRLDEQPAAVELCEGLVPSPASSGTGITPDGRRMLAAVENLPEAEREAFDMVRIQGTTQVEVARVIGVSVVTVKRRLNRGLQLLAASLEDLRRPTGSPTRPQQRGGDRRDPISVAGVMSSLAANPQRTYETPPNSRPKVEGAHGRRSASPAVARPAPRLGREPGRGLRVVA